MKLTGKRGAPLTHTLSAKRTRDGLFFNRALLLADSKVDLRAPSCSGGWHTTRVTDDVQDRTKEMTCSRGACLTSSPLTARIWSPGRS